MADNNLVLTIVLVAAALLFFNGGLSGNSTYQQSCSTPGEFSCKYNKVMECSPTGITGVVADCDAMGGRCFVQQESGQTTAVTTAGCLKRISGSSMPEAFTWRAA